MFLTFIETRDGKIKKSSLEALSEAKRRASEMAKDVSAALIGNGLDALAREALNFGASKVYLLEHPLLARYSASSYSQALYSLVQDSHPEAILFSASSMGKDLAPRVAAKLGVSLAADCTKISVSDGKLEFTRPIFAGKAFLSFHLKSVPQMATLRPNVFLLAAPGDGKGDVVKKEISMDEAQVKGITAEILGEKGGELDVTEAEVIISGGRGMKGPENFQLLKGLSAIIPRSAVGASRSAVDSGWIDHLHQVGQTGKTVSPNLYLAFGISGAIQHIAGMSSSKVIVAVNKDPEAPIFKIADYGIVGDLFQVLPYLKEEFKKALAE